MAEKTKKTDTKNLKNLKFGKSLSNWLTENTTENVSEIENDENLDNKAIVEITRAPLINFSDEDKKRIEWLKNSIDTDSVESVISYWSGVQDSIIEISQSFAWDEKTKNIWIVWNYLAEAVTWIKELENDQPRTKLWRFFKRAKHWALVEKAKYEKINELFNDITEKCRQWQDLMMTDAKIREDIFKKCELTYRDIELYKAALDEKIVEEWKNLEAMQQEFMENDWKIDAFEQQKLKLKTDMIKQLEKRYSALCTSQVSLAVSAAQANINYQSGNELIIKLQWIQQDTLPIIQIQTAVALGQEHEKAIANYVTTISDSTQELLKMSAEESHMIANQVAKEAERPLLEKETMEKVTSELIGTIEDVKKITEEWRKKRQEFDEALPKMIEDLNTTLKPE